MEGTFQPPRAIGTTVDIILRAGGIAAEIMLASLAVMVTVEVVTRNLFGISIGIVDELMGYFLVGTVFLGLGQSIREGALLRVDVFVNWLSTPVARFLDRAFAIVGVIVLCIYLYELWQLVGSSYRRGAVSGSTVAIPLWVPQSLMVIGVMLGIIGFLVLVFRPVAAQNDGAQL